MTENETGAHAPATASSPNRTEGFVRAGVFVGIVAGLVGLVDGVVMVLRRHVATCPDGTFFPEGTTDFRCFVHPQAAEGVAVSAISIMLAILIAFTALLVLAKLRSDSED